MKGSSVKLSDSEKLILLMLSEIHEHLKIKNNFIDPNLVRSAIHTGNTWALKWQYSNGAFASEDNPPHVVSEVVDILDMWDMLESSYKSLSAADKAQVEKEAEPFGRNVQFGGFDGNNENEYISVARFLIDEMGRFSDFKGRTLNSHCPSIETHQRMLDVFAPLRPGLRYGSLSAQQIIEILKAQIHPEHRKKIA